MPLLLKEREKKVPSQFSTYKLNIYSTVKINRLSGTKPPCSPGPLLRREVNVVAPELRARGGRVLGFQAQRPRGKRDRVRRSQEPPTNGVFT